MAFTQCINGVFEPINDFSEKIQYSSRCNGKYRKDICSIRSFSDDYRIQKHRGLKLNGEIEFDHIWLAYNEEEWVLKDVSFKIKAGEKWLW